MIEEEQVLWSFFRCVYVFLTEFSQLSFIELLTACGGIWLGGIAWNAEEELNFHF